MIVERKETKLKMCKINVRHLTRTPCVSDSSTALTCRSIVIKNQNECMLSLHFIKFFNITHSHTHNKWNMNVAKPRPLIHVEAKICDEDIFFLFSFLWNMYNRFGYNITRSPAVARLKSILINIKIYMLFHHI